MRSRAMADASTIHTLEAIKVYELDARCVARFAKLLDKRFAALI